MIYFMRNGQDLERVLGGFSESLLTKKGMKQVRSAAKFLKKLNIKKIVSNDLRAFKQTTNIINEELEVPVTYTKMFSNLDSFESISNREIYPDYLDISSVDKDYTCNDVYKNFNNIIDDISNLEDTLVVTHKGVINMFYNLFNNVEVNNINCASVHACDLKRKKISKVY